MNHTPSATALLVMFVAGLLACSASQAQLTVNKSVVEISAVAPMQDVDIVNSGQHKIYVKLSAAEIINPESDAPKRNEITDPRTAPLLVSPLKLVITPGQRKRVRLILRDPPRDKDRIFRVTVKPFTGDVALAESKPGAKASAIKILIGYDLLLIARPADAAPNLVSERRQNTLRLTNLGNTNVLLQRIRQCDSSGQTCETLQPNRLYAGESYQLELPINGSAESAPVETWQTVGRKNFKAIY